MFKNCTACYSQYPHGLGRLGARDKSKSADHRADIYSLGVVFYELLTGELPVGRFDPPSRRRQVDSRLDDVVLKALEKDPERRYQRASHLGRDVDRISTTTPTTPTECPIVDLTSGKRIGTSSGLRFAVHAVACPLTVKNWDKDEIGFSIDETLLRRIDDRTHGQYFRATDHTGLTKIYEAIDKLERTTLEDQQFTEYRQFYGWCVVAAITLVVLALLARGTVLRRLP